MSKLTPLERNLLVALARAEGGLDVFSLYSRFRCSPSELFRTATRLERREWLSIEDNRVAVTKKGREWIMANRRYLAAPGDKSWREIPSEFQRHPLLWHETYVPRTSRVHRSVLPPEWKRGNH